MAEVKKRIKKLPCPVCNTVIDVPKYINSSCYTGHIVCSAENCNTVLNVIMRKNQIIKLVIDKEVKSFVIEKRDSMKGYALLNRFG